MAGSVADAQTITSEEESGVTSARTQRKSQKRRNSTLTCFHLVDGNAASAATITSREETNVSDARSKRMKET